MIRHGDCVVRKVESLPQDAKLIQGRKELAYGEVTGHAHRIDMGELFETKDGKLYCKIRKKTTLSHEEHKNIVLDPGCYEVVIKRQYTPDGWTNVRD